MAPCPERELALNALIDGELDALAAAELETHLRGCPACTARLAELESVRGMLGALREVDAAPDALRRRIEAEIGRPPRSAPRAVPWLGGAAVGALAATLALTLAAPPTPYLADELVAAHVRSLQAAHLIDVATSDRHVVKPWFNGRLAFSPPVPDLAAQGFPLVGGRLEYLHGGEAAALVYKRRLHTINVIVTPARDAPAWTAQTRGTYNLAHWREGGLDFWAVSDVSADDLKTFAAAFRAAASL